MPSPSSSERFPPTTICGSASPTGCSGTSFRSWRPHSARQSRGSRQESSRLSTQSPRAICRRCVSSRMRWSRDSTQACKPTRWASPPTSPSGKRSRTGSGPRSDVPSSPPFSPPWASIPAEFFGTFTKIDEVIDDVIADPGVVGRNAVAALGLGFKQFGTNFIGNFTAAFVEWITGAAAIVLPKTFSLAGIFDVVCQVLNLTKAYLRKKGRPAPGRGGGHRHRRAHRGGVGLRRPADGQGCGTW